MDEELNVQATEAAEPEACGNCEACGRCEPARNETPETPVTVADIQFRGGGKTYYFDPGELVLKTGDHVIIDTARGVEYGICEGGNHTVSSRLLVLPLRKVLRLATAQDEKTMEDHRRREKDAFAVCQKKIEEHKLDMQLVSAEYTFDGSKVLFFFTADGRVDFRELVKDLASVLRMRIELRQIGVRDKAKMLGGLGICGRPFCCKEFLEDFEPVSIKMAKTQNLSLNPTKISGTCGRLMCCLKYEQEAYEDLLKTAPKAESFVDTPDGRGTITDVNLLRQSVRVRMEKAPDTFGNYKVDEIYVIRNGKARKTDAPIPEDFAPISSQPRRRRLQAEEPLPEVRLNGEALTEEAPAEPTEHTESRGRSRNRHRRKPAGAPQQEKPTERTEKPAKPEGEAEKKPGTGNRRRRPHHHRGGHGGGGTPAAQS